MRNVGPVPKGWIFAPIGELARINPREFDREPGDEERVSFVPMTLVEAGSGRLDSSSSRFWRDVRKGYTRFQENDVLFAKITPCMENAKFALAANLISGRGAGSTEFHVIRPTAAILPKFILYHLLQEGVRREARLSMRGAAGQLRVPPEFIDRLEIPVAPVLEQARIIEEIEKQFTRLDAAVAALKRIHANLKRYRAAVLKAACEGRLVPTEAELARREGRSYEPASVLLERILAERRSRWEADQLAKFRSQGNQPKNDKWKARYKPPDRAHHSFDLPEGWAAVSLGQLTWSVKDGPHYSPTYTQEGIPFITGGQVRPSGVDFDAAKRISAELHADLTRRCKPEYGDILYTKGGTTGIARVNTYRCEFSVWVHVAVLKLVPSLEAFYVQHALNSPTCYAQARRFTHGVGNQDLGLTRMVNILFGLPPLAEQRRIVEEVERSSSIVEELEIQAFNNLRRADALRQAILKHAFQGKLVIQDQNDEPAKVLLERIRGDRDAAAHKGAPTSPRRPRKKEAAHVSR